MIYEREAVRAAKEEEALKAAAAERARLIRIENEKKELAAATAKAERDAEIAAQ